MKLLFYIVGALQLICSPAKAQTIANEKMNIVYRGMDNPISVAMFGYNCNEIKLKANREKLTQTDCGKYIIHPENTGQIYLTIYSTNNGIETEIDSIMFRSIEIPESSTNIEKTRYFSIVKLRTEVEFSKSVWQDALEGSLSIISFNYLLLRDTSIIATGINESDQFKEELLESIKKSQPGDILFFDKILVEDNEKRLRRINSIRLMLEI